MSKKITRSELEAIGQNWLERRNRLLAAAWKQLFPMPYRLRAFRLAFIMNNRLTKIIIALGQQKPLKDFASGGFVSPVSAANNEGGEVVIKKAKGFQP